MKVHRVTLCVIDFDELGADGVASVIENTRYPNHCIYPEVRAIETRDIGEWSDGHPLNQRDTGAAEFTRLFSDAPPG